MVSKVYEKFNEFSTRQIFKEKYFIATPNSQKLPWCSDLKEELTKATESNFFETFFSSFQNLLTAKGSFISEMFP